MPHRLKAPILKLRATISADVDAMDWAEAGEHQKRFEECLVKLREHYPDIEFELKPRRERAKKDKDTS